MEMNPAVDRREFRRCNCDSFCAGACPVHPNPSLPTPIIPYKQTRDADGFGICDFCACSTNANLRRCCDAGYRADGGR